MMPVEKSYKPRLVATRCSGSASHTLQLNMYQADSATPQWLMAKKKSTHLAVVSCSTRDVKSVSAPTNS